MLSVGFAGAACGTRPHARPRCHGRHSPEPHECLTAIIRPSLPATTIHASTTCLTQTIIRKTTAKNKQTVELRKLLFHVCCVLRFFVFGGISNYWETRSISHCLSSPFPSLMILDVRWYRCTVRCPDDAAIAAVPVLECSHVQHRSAPLHRLCYSSP